MSWLQTYVICTVGLFCMILVTAGKKMLGLNKKKKKIPEISLAVFKFRNGSLFCCPRCASKFCQLQTGVLWYVPRPFRLLAANRWSFCWSWDSAVSLVPEWCLYRREIHSRIMVEKTESCIKVLVYCGCRRCILTKTVTVVAYTFAFIGTICLRSPSRQWLAILCLVYGKTQNWHLVAIHK